MNEPKTAFPFVSHGGLHEHQHVDTGMTLRDYFAAKAMQGFAADPQMTAGAKTIAKLAYVWADEMLKARG